MDSRLNISDSQYEANGPSVSNKSEFSALDKGHVKSTPITLDDKINNKDSVDAKDEANDRSVTNEIESSTAITPFETEPLKSDNVKSARIASNESTYRT